MRWEKGQTPEGAKPFSKGQSGNPQGRPAGTENSRTRLKRLLSYEIQTINELTGEIENLSAVELMDIAIIQKALTGDVKAYAEILNRMEGKPTEMQAIQEQKQILVVFKHPNNDRGKDQEDNTEERGTICSQDASQHN